MSRRRARPAWPILAALVLGFAPAPVLAQETTAPAAPASVSDLLAAHDRALIAALRAYIARDPRAADVEQAYLNLFETAIKNDWFADHEADAQAYLKAYPDGAVRPMAQIVATLARAQAGRFDEAAAGFDALLAGLGGSEQLPFAADFVDTLAGEATAAGAVAVARRVYQAVLARFPDEAELRAKVQDELARLDLVGRPAPLGPVTDAAGRPLDLRGLRGKYVLLDFWATWCAPCAADLPRLRAAREKFAARGFEVVGVSLDEDAGAVADYARRQRLPWPQVHNATAGADLVAAFRVGAIPDRVLIGPDGTVVRLGVRARDLEATLGALLDGAK